MAAQSGATDLIATANQAFVDAMSTTAGIAAAFLPARASAEPVQLGGPLAEGAAA